MNTNGRQESRVESRESLEIGLFSRCHRLSSLGPGSVRGAFTLLEVMIAGAILFMCLFSILALVSNGVRNARALQATKADPRSSIASTVYYELAHTNSLTEGSGSGDFEDYHYDWEVRQVETNGLCEVDINVSPSSGGQAPPSALQMLMYLPQMQQRPGGAGAR
jgi:Tfp pilus assembly protein PilV